LLDVLSKAVDDIWQVEPYCVGPMGQARPYPLFSLVGPAATNAETGQEFISHTFDRILEAVNYDQRELSKQAATLYFRPAQWIERYAWDFKLPDAERYRRHAKGEIIQAVLGIWLKLHPSLASYAMLSERIVTLLRGPGSRAKPDLYHPTLQDLLHSILEDTSAETSEICQQLVVGAMGTPQNDSVEEPELRKLSPLLYLRLWKEKKFDYPDFKQAMEALPAVLQDLTHRLDSVPLPEAYRDLPGEFALVLHNFCYTLASELAEKLVHGDELAASLLKHYSELVGDQWLLIACAYLEEKNLTRLPASNRWRTSKSAVSAVVRLCMAHRGEITQEETAHTIEFLSQYKPATLLATLPFAHEYQELICKALGWEGAYEVVKLIETENPADLDEDLPTIAPAHLEAILQTYQTHIPTRRKRLDLVQKRFKI
jgi:hypothetical protein